MQEKLKESLVEMVKASTEVLSDEDALAIVEICKNATDREIASVTEQYMVESINNNNQMESDSE